MTAQTATAPVAATAPAATESAPPAPSAGEVVVGRKMTVVFLVGLITATIVATVAIQAWVSSQITGAADTLRQEVKENRQEVRENLMEVKANLVSIRSDMKDGFRDLREDMRLIRTDTK